MGTVLGGRRRSVLLSDGEDACAPPDPCEVADDLHATRPDVTISVVEFLTRGVGLACLADTTGGVFVSADNADQLGRRLTGAADPATARRRLSPQGAHGISVGQRHDQIRSAHPDFPDLSSGRAAATKAGFGVTTIIVWRDCEYGFTTDGTLIQIQATTEPTIDGLMAGASASEADGLYGDPVSVSAAPAGGEVRTYPATTAGASDLGWHVVASREGIIQTIVLCRCIRPQIVRVTSWAAFAVSGGATRCVLDGDEAYCHSHRDWPPGYENRGEKWCPADARRDQSWIAGVAISGSRSGWWCHGGVAEGALIIPALDTPGTAWHRKDWPTLPAVEGEGAPVKAVLPSGWGLTNGRITCKVTGTEARCQNLRNGVWFLLSARGVSTDGKVTLGRVEFVH